MSIRKVKTSSGESKWEVRIHEDGRGSRRVTRRFERKNDAEAFVQEFKQELIEKARDPFAGISLKDRNFREEAELWFNDGKIRFTESHLKRANGILKTTIQEYGAFTIDRFTPDFLSEIQQKEKLKGLSNSSVNRKTEVITAILNFSTKRRRIPYNPAVGFRKLKRESKEMEFWSKEEAISFLSKMNEVYPRNSQHRWIFVAYLIALNTAMRAGEIWGLQVQDLASAGNSFWIRRQFNRVTNAFGPTKGKKARHVPCSEDLESEVHALIKSQNLNSLSTVFRNEKGNPICHDNFSDRQFAKDLLLWGGKRVRFHDLRHTATTLMIANGIDIKTVKEICGHADIQTTMNYVHMLSGSIANVAKTFSLNPVSQGKEVSTEIKLKLV
ncbi:MAG: tyrosine-type recombinase/integrase [Pseudobdellovibrionaceae bacterium]